MAKGAGPVRCLGQRPQVWSRTHTCESLPRHQELSTSVSAKLPKVCPKRELIGPRIQQTVLESLWFFLVFYLIIVFGGILIIPKWLIDDS